MKKLKIVHDNKLLWAILGLIILLVIVIGVIIQDRNEIKEVIREDLCIQDSDCVPSSSCHPTECIIKERFVDPGMQICTAVCSGPLDCGAGSCGCVSNKCEVVPTK